VFYSTGRAATAVKATRVVPSLPFPGSDSSPVPTIRSFGQFATCQLGMAHTLRARDTERRTTVVQYRPPSGQLLLFRALVRGEDRKLSRTTVTEREAGPWRHRWWLILRTRRRLSVVCSAYYSREVFGDVAETGRLFLTTLNRTPIRKVGSSKEGGGILEVSLVLKGQRDTARGDDGDRGPGALSELDTGRQEL
jgi:hypothetical protein